MVLLPEKSDAMTIVQRMIELMRRLRNTFLLDTGGFVGCWASSGMRAKRSERARQRAKGFEMRQSGAVGRRGVSAVNIL
jgi:hypothetical protein